MKRKTGLVVLLFFLFLGFLFFHSHQTLTDWKKETTFRDKITNQTPSSVVSSKQLYDCNNVYLKTEIIDYPKKIESMCQKVSFKLKVKNVGKAPLNFADIDKKKYSFDLSSPKQSAGATTDIWRVKDFGAIAPGETKIVEFYHKTEGNGFDFSEGNKGNVELAITFLRRKLTEQGYYPVCSNKPKVKIFINQNVGEEADFNQCSLEEK